MALVVVGLAAGTVLVGCTSTGPPLSSAVTVDAALRLADLPGYWTDTAPTTQLSAGQLSQAISGPGCEPVSLRRSVDAISTTTFRLSLDPANESFGDVYEHVWLTRSAAAAAALHRYVQTATYRQCLVQEFNRSSVVTHPGVEGDFEQVPTPYTLPPDESGVRLIDRQPAASCGCEIAYDFVDVQVGAMRAAVQLGGTVIPTTTRATIANNAVARMTSAEHRRGVEAEVLFPHPVAHNDLMVAPSLASPVAPDDEVPIAWRPLPDDGLSSLNLTPGGVVFRDDHQGPVWALAPAQQTFSQERNDADVRVVDGSATIVGLGCAANDAT
jgi:hypothetical protein